MHQELVTIVDEHDNLVATKSRDNLTSEDIIRVAVLWIEDGKGNVLLQQRSMQKKIGAGLWGPAVAGTVEAHETYITNIVKEAEEEIGLVGLQPELVAKKLFWEKEGQFGRMFTFFKTLVTKPALDFTIKPDEVAQVKWVNKHWLLQDALDHPELYVPSAVFWQELFG